MLYLLVDKNTMKRTRKNFKKIKKTSIKKRESALVILFFIMVIIFQKDKPNTEFQFVRNSTDMSMHAAGNKQRDYLFEDDGEEQTQTNPSGNVTN